MVVGSAFYQLVARISESVGGKHVIRVEADNISGDVMGGERFIGIKVRPHRRWAAAAGNDQCPWREGFRTVLWKIAVSPSNRRRAEATDQSRSQRAADICVLETDLPGGQDGMGEELTETLIEKVRGYVRLNVYAETVIFAQAFPLLIDFVHPPPSPFFFYNSVLTKEEVHHRNWTS